MRILARALGIGAVLLSAMSMALCGVGGSASAAEPSDMDTVAVEDDSTVSDARGAFIHLTANVLDLLDTRTRLDMLDYYDLADTVRKVPNALDGLSWILPPANDSYIKVQLTPVSALTIKRLDHKRGHVFAVAYTISGNGSAADSELSFWDENLKRIPAARMIKLANVDNFINLPRRDKSVREDIMDVIPYPMVEYTFSPDNDTLTARLTVADYIGIENFRRISPYLHKSLKYTWNGHKYILHRQ